MAFTEKQLKDLLIFLDRVEIKGLGEVIVLHDLIQTIREEGVKSDGNPEQ